MGSTTRWLAVIALGLILCSAPSAYAGNNKAGWSVTLYGGPASHSRVSDIFQGLGHLNGGMVGLAVDKDLFDLGWDISVAAEAQLTGYLFDTYYGTGALGIGVRFHHFPWDNTSLGIYSGPSYAVDPPKVADYHYGPSYRMRKFLNYVGVEFAVAIPHYARHWDMVMRIYHRSGAWGLYSKNVDEGSMVGVGIRARF